MWAASVAVAVALGAWLNGSSARAGNVLVSVTRDTSQLGYGQTLWSEMTGRIDAAAGGQLSTVADLTDLNQMLNFGGLWIDLREFQTGALSGAESANLSSYLNTGRRAVLIGENQNYGTWNASVLAAVGGGYSGGTAHGTSPTTGFVPLTAGVASTTLFHAGVASAAGGGASLFADRVATVWGPARNALVVLDANAFDDDRAALAGNGVFAGNVASWITGGASNGSISWNASAGGSWGGAANWAGGFMPSVADDALFAAGGGGYIVSVSAGVIARNVVVPADQIELRLAAGGVFTVNQSISVGQTAGSSASLALGASGGAAPVVVSAASLALGGAGGGWLRVNPRVELTVSGAAVIGSGGRVIVVPVVDPGNEPTVLRINTLNFTGGGQLDLGNSRLITRATLASVQSALVSGALFTSVSTGGTLGYLDIGDGQIEVRFTLPGDTNLDAAVDVSDLGNFAGSYGAASGATWAQGDFDRNGAVDVSDLGNLASSYGAALGASPAVVPEPATTAAACATLAAMVLLPRRSRRLVRCPSRGAAEFAIHRVQRIKPAGISREAR